MCLSGSLSCGDSSDVQFASASQSVLPSIAFQDLSLLTCDPMPFQVTKETTLIKRQLLSELCMIKETRNECA
jgi:hypothetical protein